MQSCWVARPLIWFGWQALVHLVTNSFLNLCCAEYLIGRLFLRSIQLPNGCPCSCCVFSKFEQSCHNNHFYSSFIILGRNAWWPHQVLLESVLLSSAIHQLLPAFCRIQHFSCLDFLAPSRLLSHSSTLSYPPRILNSIKTQCLTFNSSNQKSAWGNLIGIFSELS